MELSEVVLSVSVAVFYFKRSTRRVDNRLGAWGSVRTVVPTVEPAAASHEERRTTKSSEEINVTMTQQQTDNHQA
jgi:hypothetical protein